MLEAMTKRLPRNPPPRKQHGEGKGQRVINGAVFDVRCGSRFLGWSEKKTRGLVARNLIPFRRQSGRIIFLRTELEQWLASLPGVTLDEARKNVEQRQ
jgi:hypothetical protein